MDVFERGVLDWIAWKKEKSRKIDHFRDCICVQYWVFARFVHQTGGGVFARGFFSIGTIGGWTGVPASGLSKMLN